MANVNKIEYAGGLYDVEDTTARTAANAASAAADALEAVIGDIDVPLATTAQNLIGAVNEIVPKVQSREIVTIVTEKAESSDTSELYPADLASAGNKALLGSYIVTVHRNTSSSMTWFIGWIEFDSNDFYDCSFHKLDGQGYSLSPLPNYNGIRYTGGDESEVTTWIFQPIGDSFTDY